MVYPEDEQKNETTSESEATPPQSAEVKPPAAAEKTKPEQPTGEKAPKKETKAEKKPAKKAPKEAVKSKQKKGAKAEKSGKKKDQKQTAPEALPQDYEPRLKTRYRTEIVPALMKRFNYKNVMMAPQLQKIVLNVGIGDASQNPKLLESVIAELAAIAGQQPAITRARKSISNFKLRAGMAIGCRVTLRGWRMWEFLDRLMSVAIPRIRDFRGLPDRSFDGRGNYTFGIREQIIFPEIDIDKIERVHGMNITIATTAKSDEEAHALLQELGWPFRRRQPTQASDQAA